MTILYVTVGFGILVLALILVSSLGGKAKAEKKQAIKEKKHAEKVNAIGSDPPVDKPADRL